LLSAVKIRLEGEKMLQKSSGNFGKALDIFQTLTPLELKYFSMLVRDFAQHNEFNLNNLVEAKNDDGIKCPYCMEPKGIVKYGIRREIQWYKCKPCGRTFSGVTGTFLCRTKKGFQTWENFVQSMMDGHSVRKAAEVCNIHRNTAWTWRHKVLDTLAQYQARRRPMKGIVEADDTFFPLSYKGGKPVGRRSYRRGTPAKKRGLSREKVCVSCAVERNGQVFSQVSALGTPKAEALRRVFRKRFTKKAVVCTDNATAYVKYGESGKFTHFRVPNGIRVLDIYHVQNINS
jgi:transposase-like protein